MPPHEALTAAVAAGIISHDQAEKLEPLLAPHFGVGAVPGARPATAVATAARPDPDEESIRFLRGFHDVFLTIGLVALMVGLGIGLPLLAGPVAGAFGSAVIVWLLAEFFSNRRRLVLPSMALATGFVLFVGVGVAATLSGPTWGLLFESARRAVTGDTVFLAAALGGLAAALVFFGRFRLPFALMLVAAAATAVLLTAVGMAFPGGLVRYWPWLLLGAGLISFAAAMAFDVSDPLRRTLRTDNAFWLHLFAAPLIVHATVMLLIRNDRTSFTVADGLVVIALVAALALAALVIDRRALLVSALGYLGFAIASLLRSAAVSDVGMVAATLIMVGGFVVVLGAGWKPARRALLGWVPPQRLTRYLPPVGLRTP